MQEIENLKRIQLLTSYIQHRQDEIAKYNTTHNVDKTIAINGRNMTNFGVFRKYITQYLTLILTTK